MHVEIAVIGWPRYEPTTYYLLTTKDVIYTSDIITINQNSDVIIFKQNSDVITIKLSNEVTF
jgi:hypothetical protein